MPRAIPWLSNGDGGKKGKQKASTEKASATAKSATRHETDADIVNSDLDDIVPLKKAEGKRPEKKRVRAASSSPPPPLGPPPVERMKPGFAADDIFMMVEDEFLSTAQMYTGHIHHAEYARLRKLHKSRGQEILAGLGRGTDGKTEQSMALRMKMEQSEKQKKQKETLRKVRPEADGESDAEGSGAEDEYKQDAHLAGLMKASQTMQVPDLTGLGKPRANTRAAAGYSQSPYKPERTKDVFAEERQQQRQRNAMPKVDEGEEEGDSDDLDVLGGTGSSTRASAVPAVDDSETDSDDLDAGVPSDPERKAISAWAEKVVVPAKKSTTTAKVKVDVRKPSESRPFAKFARPKDEAAPQRPRVRSPKREVVNESMKKLTKSTVKPETSPCSRTSRPTAGPTPPRESKYSATMARRKAEREAQRKQIKKEEVDEIPTFLF